jgi:alkanesulfonate monooxygenase SsuD/methylene tetrahydromethanopterin reductase-like flavin-dependent oxidoreductase (luciferase family)
MFDAFRAASPDDHPNLKLAYMPLVFTGETEEEAAKGAEALTWYIKSKSEPQFRNPPGYVPVSFNVNALKGTYSGRTDAVRRQGIDYLKEQGVVIAGTPDQVIAQIRRFHDLVGGFRHLLMMQQAGFLDHATTVKSMTLFAKEVYPAIRDLGTERTRAA